jgi:hypothetical protein
MDNRVESKYVVFLLDQEEEAVVVAERKDEKASGVDSWKGSLTIKVRTRNRKSCLKQRYVVRNHYDSSIIIYTQAYTQIFL